MVIYPTGQSRGLSDLSVVTDPEMPEKAVRWRFTTKYKRRILRGTGSYKELGQMDVLLRRECLCSSKLFIWRWQAKRGTLKSLSLRKRNTEEKKPNPSISRIAELEKQKLEHKIQQADLTVAAQKTAKFFQRRLYPKGVTSS
jgi:hypothetical protein